MRFRVLRSNGAPHRPRWLRSSPARRRPRRGCPSGPGASHWQIRPRSNTGTLAKRRCGCETRPRAAEKASEEHSCYQYRPIRQVEIRTENGSPDHLAARVDGFILLHWAEKIEFGWRSPFFAREFTVRIALLQIGR